MKHAPSRLSRWLLALLVLGAGIVGTTIMFLLNRVVVATFCYALLPSKNIQVVKLQTVLMLIGPVLMLLPEWWLLDIFGRFLAKLFGRRMQTARTE